MTVLRIEFDDGEEIELDVLNGNIINDYQKQSHAEVQLIRDEWIGVIDQVDKLNDEFYLVRDNEDLFGGRLVASEIQNETADIEIGSFEEDALSARPTTSSEKLDGVNDAVVVEEAIDRVNELEPGNIEATTNTFEIILSNKSPAEIIREAQRLSGAFVRYNPDKTVDYLERPPLDESDFEISPDKRNIDDSFDVEEDEREEVTHVKLLGASEGESQITLTALTDLYDPDKRENWVRYTDKDVTSLSKGRELIDALVEEYNDSLRKLKISTTIIGEDVEVGSRVRVVSNRVNIDHLLWVKSLDRSLDGKQDSFEVMLSNRLITDEDDTTKLVRDVEKYNQGFEGVVVTVNAGGFRGVVDEDNDYTFSIRYPEDVEDELTAQVQIEGLPYRDDNIDDGITEYEDETPTDVSLRIGRFDEDDEEFRFTTVENNIASGEFNEVVSIADELRPGINIIELSSDSLGDIRGTVFLDLYRQIIN